MKSKSKDKSDALLAQHHAEMARASAAAMEEHYQETIEICSELLTTGIYEELASRGDIGSVEAARRCRAETRLLLATAMHYAEGHYEDIRARVDFCAGVPGGDSKRCVLYPWSSASFIWKQTGSRLGDAKVVGDHRAIAGEWR